MNVASSDNPILTVTPSKESSDLREWMEATFGGLRKDRSTESYALEYLKTGQSNLLLSQARANLTLAASELEYHFNWVKEQLNRLDELIIRIKALEKHAK